MQRKIIKKEQWEEMYSDHTKGLTDKQIADKHEVSRKTVQRAISRGYLTNGQRKPGERLRPHEKAEIRKMHGEGISIEEITSKMKISAASAYKIIGKKTALYHDTEKAYDIDYKLEINKKKVQVAKNIFRQLKPGQIVTLEKTIEDKRHKVNTINGKVIQITGYIVTLQDMDRPHRRESISIKDLLSSQGGVRIQLVG